MTIATYDTKHLSRSQQFLAALILMASLGFITIALYRQAQEQPPGTYPFSIDFYAFWSGYKLYDQGMSPYDHSLLLEQERSLSTHVTGPIYYSPVMLVLLSPILQLDFPPAVSLFAMLNLLLLFVASFCAWYLTSNQPVKPDSALLATFLFIPALNALQFGQLSILVTACFYLALVLVKKGYLWSAALPLVFVGIKPHLVYLGIIALMWHLLRSRKSAPLIGASLFAGLALLHAQGHIPGIVLEWFERARETQIHAAVSLITPLRWILLPTLPKVIPWVPILLPGAAIAILLMTGVGARFWERSFQALPLLVAGSVLTSPYLWIFDHSALLLVHIATWSATFAPDYQKTKRRLVLSCSVGYQLLILCLECFDVLDHRLWWFPIPLLFLWYYAQRSIITNPKAA